MQIATNTYLSKFNKSNAIQSNLRRATLFLSLIVILLVFWCLKLTGITMADEAFCGKDEHIHGDSCPTGKLICTVEETEGHVHSERCILRELRCQQPEVIAHTHNADCLHWELICLTEEQEAHIHDTACCEQLLVCTEEACEAHVHDDSCREQSLICFEEEREGHTHDDSCRKWTLTCPEEEREGHVHGDDCFVSTVICTDEDPAHMHDSACYETILTCAAEECEGHSHDDTCYTPEEDWICGLEEDAGHVHTEECYLWIEGSFLCGLEETEGHAHTADCYLLLEDSFLCGKEETEGHTHTEACYVLIEDSFLCDLPETEGHLHTEECYYIGIGFGCGLTEAEGHIHTQECVTEDTELGCGMDDMPPHIHTEECFVRLESCPLEEHIHDESCYSDIRADLESEDDWEAEIALLEEETSTGRMLAAVAQSQLGYGESQRNFEVDRYGVRRGITRYGQWYGNPYGDWSAMFVSFCLHYADVDDLPANAGPESMRLEWEEEDLYRSWEEHEPRIGDVVFLLPQPEEDPSEISLLSADQPEMLAEEPPVFDREGDSAAAVAIITDIDRYGMTIVQGDVDGMVEELWLEADDPAILGYGLVPERSPYVMLMAAPRADTATYLASTIDFRTDMFTSGRKFVLYTERDGVFYAIGCTDSAGTAAYAIPVEIDSDGAIYTDSEDPDILLWTFTRSGNRFIIQNVATGLYLHPFNNGGNNYGLINQTNWDTPVVASGTGAKLSHSASVRLNNDASAFVTTTDSGQASVMYFGFIDQCTVYLDGAQGDLMSLRGSDLESYTVMSGSTITLPTQWKSPDKYSYVLKGWYDVENGLYYQPGEEVMVTENMLLYADWVAATYDVGEMNSHVVDTISTSEFITTHMFDYNSLFNILSQTNDYNPSIGGSSTEWTLVESGIVDTTGKETFDFIFVDHDGSGVISHPIGRNDENGVVYQEVTPGLYDPDLADLLFNPDIEVIGKEYVGSGDHLFQYGDDPSDGEHYGYYYYDSRLNAASYNQSNERFYVYDYLERTTDSPGNDSYSDFLPFNSPYANTNGNSVGTYTHNGQPGYFYDAKYSDSNNSTSRVGVNYALGMALEMEFYLPSVPGTVDSEGTLANQSIVGEDMVFEFSGDDDVWVLIDGKLVLDIGGIHLIKSGSIDFSTGKVIVEGEQTGSVTYLKPGAHTLTMYYLERGASMSNFRLRFNLSTRYSMTLRKEDTLTAQLLNGAQFAVYTDEACTEQYAAELWDSKAAHERGEDPTNVFTVKNGKAEMWGLAAGNTYYLVEIRGPDTMQGVPAKGIIRMRLNNQGLPDYEVMPDHGNLTVGYMVHGYKVNEDLQEAYLTITNTDAIDSEPVEISVEKVWNDTENHRGDSITVHLVANGARIQSVTLNEENDWKHIWTNLPSADRNGEEVTYTVQEATFPGYISAVTGLSAGGAGSAGDTVVDANKFENGKTYLLYTKYGYIGAADNKLVLEGNQDTAREDNRYLWMAVVHSDGTITLTNKSGQTMYWDNYMLRASSSPGANKKLYYTDGTIQHLISAWNQWQYPGDSTNVPNNVTYNFGIYTTNSGAALPIVPQTLAVTKPPAPDSGQDGEEPVRNFRITNTPVGDATVSLRVNKVWDVGNLGTEEDYEETGVRMELQANGRDAGLSGTLNLRNGWSYTFQDLPMFDSQGNEIAYTVREAEVNAYWRVEYGPVTLVSGSNNAYETTVTNVYRATVQLPSTGSSGPYGYRILGLSIMLGGLGWYCRQKRKDERREC